MKKRKGTGPRRLERKKPGLTCGKCRTFIPADVYALAHTNVELKTKCPKCGKEVAGYIR